MQSFLGPCEGGKETFYFGNEQHRFTACDAHVEDYQRHVAMQRLLAADRAAKAGAENGLSAADAKAMGAAAASNVLVGDWSATHFSCICCPMVFKTLNPKMKLMVMLRDPIQRVLSRFLEQKRGKHLPFYSQVLVLYTDDLAQRPLETFRRVEAFLGAPPHEYDQRRSAMVFNSRECYSWKCGRTAGEIRPMAAVGDGSGVAEDGPFAAAVGRLASFYRPHVQRLFRWADEGRIAQPPAAWREAYK
ncbi:hypothetical protein GPECTOR_55g321 [Gonium pectorale]|uniref:Sulfotransferase n=1 Tax=Gonium pectorale TaxID=33097 RepID=A0A150G793_GONPE|nr:hypothetical protein GPECTOR_55g321 [Gonium pectorale]|eukprot:KXZ45415.1 hypothetical protein GPECTOR_55g321 [Gonium pectorale]